MGTKFTVQIEFVLEDGTLGGKVQGAGIPKGLLARSQDCRR